MSDLLTFRLAIARSSTDRLWRRGFADILSHLDLRTEQMFSEETAVTNLNGNSVIWFDTGSDAWRWLRSHDGLISLWANGQANVGISIHHESIGYRRNNTLQSEVSISADLPTDAPHAKREGIVSIAESVATAILDECRIVRGIAYDEGLYERLRETASQTDADLASELPEWLGYWNAVPMECFNDQLRPTFERIGGVVEQRQTSTVIRLAKWPWELAAVDVRELATLLPC
jgi:hypothetical protein